MITHIIGCLTIAVALLIAAGFLSGFIKLKKFDFRADNEADDDEDDDEHEEEISALRDKFNKEFMRFDEERMVESENMFERTRKYLVEFAKEVREHGPLALEHHLQDETLSKKYKTLCRGIQMLVDGTEPADIARWFDNVAMVSGDSMEKVYAEMIKQGFLLIAEGRHPNAVEFLLSAFDLDLEVM